MILVCLVFLVLLAIGVPVAVTVGLAGYIGAILAAPIPLAVTVQTILHQVDSFVLLSLPLFILAGALMETGGIAHRLVRLAVALVGWVRGGLGMAVVAAEYIFSGISGSTVADVSAIGSTMIPPMLRAGYRPEQAVAVVSAASAMGILVPPCILMIVIGSVANVSVAALFAAGFVPAVVIALKGNDVQVAFEILAPVMAQIKGGALRPLAVTSDKRYGGLPGVPTVAESGVRGYQAASWNGLAAPARTPKALIDRLNREVNAATGSPEVRKRLQDLGVEARGGAPEALRDLLVSEIAKWKAVIERAKIEKQ